MIKVIEPGDKEFICVCSTCGCKFSYTIDDIQSSLGRIICPECHHFNVHICDKYQDYLKMLNHLNDISNTANIVNCSTPKMTYDEMTTISEDE